METEDSLKKTYNELMYNELPKLLAIGFANAMEKYRNNNSSENNRLVRQPY